MYPVLSVPMRVLSPIRDRCALAFVNSLKICGEWDGLTRVISVPSWAAAWASRHSTYKSWSCHLAASSSFVKLSNCCWVSFTRLGCLGECGLPGFPPTLPLWGLLGEDGPVDLTSLHSSAISPSSTAAVECQAVVETSTEHERSSSHQYYGVQRFRPALGDAMRCDWRAQRGYAQTQWFIWKGEKEREHWRTYVSTFKRVYTRQMAFIVRIASRLFRSVPRINCRDTRVL